MSNPGTIYRINWQSYSMPHLTTGEPQDDLQCFADIGDNSTHLNSGAITTPASFISLTNYITIADISLISFFYVGQVIAITGTSLNNVTATVLSFNIGTFLLVRVNVALVGEGPVSATLTDQSTIIVPNIIELEGAGDPCRPSVIDNNEDPFTVILAQQLTIRFNSSTSVGMSTFIKGSDQRFSVHYYLGTDTQTIFKGFLVSGDNAISEEFLYPPNVVTLTANDGLPLLKDIPQTDFDGDNPVDWNPIIDHLAICLSKTGLSLPIMVGFNIKLVGMNNNISIPNATNEHIFDKVYLHAKTFEDEIGSCVNCYQSIEIPLGHEARLFQYMGKWWIVRVDEIEDATRGLYITEFAANGDFVGNLGEFNFVKEIGGIKDIVFSNATTSVTATRATKSLRLNYNFEIPLELPCNVDFSRGTIFSDTTTLKKYTVECWGKWFKNGSGIDTVSTANIYIEVQFTDGYETNRYLHYEDNGAFNFLKSENIYVSQGDKFDISVGRRMESNHGTGGTDTCVQVRLYGDDGTFWTHHGKDAGAAPDSDTAYWEQCTADFNTNQHFFVYEISDDQDDTENIELYSGEAAEVPVTGHLVICLFNSALWGATEDTYIHSVIFNYKPYINGSYGRYTGQYHSCFQDDPDNGTFKKKIKEPVYMSDSPKKIFKGAMFVFNSGTSRFDLAGLFYNAAVFPTGPPDSTYHHRYGEIQLFDVWNQHKDERRVVQFNAQGVDLDKTFTISGDTLPYPAHLINKWSLTDTSEHVANKFFLLLHFDQDHATAEWSGVLREVVDLIRPKDYSNHDFKFISG